MDQNGMEKVGKILDKYTHKKGILIQLLLDIQSEFNWIPPEIIKIICKRFQIPVSHIYRVASFYRAMSLHPRGQHLVRVCLGTACHVRGGEKLMEKTQKLLGLQDEGTTPDLKFTLEKVSCLGCCALGPVLVTDGQYHGRLTVPEVEKILKAWV
jgi:NADH-quinone oxidoreductase subunit E